jgi:hypothetical protein
LDVDAYIV